MGLEDSKSHQLRVRVTAEDRDLLEKLRIDRNGGETISDLVREAIALLVKPGGERSHSGLNPVVQEHVERLAELLKRQPRQVEEACIEGILDLIENRCDVPLIVMETHLHLKYRGKDEKGEFPWNSRSPSESMIADTPPAGQPA